MSGSRRPLPRHRSRSRRPGRSTWSPTKLRSQPLVTATRCTSLAFPTPRVTSPGSSKTYIAAVDGLARNFYLYPDTQNAPNVYWFGTILPDFSADGAVGGPVNMKATWNAASKVQRYTPFGGLNT